MWRKPMLVLVDVDSTVAELLPVWVAHYNKDYNDTLDWRSIDKWAIHEFVKPECGTKIYDYLQLPELYDTVQPVEGSLEGVDRIRAAGHRVVFVTAGVYPAKYRWLIRNGYLPSGLEGEKDFIICTDKNLINGDVLIDDAFHNIDTFDGWGIMLTAEYNKEFDVVHRANGWKDIAEIMGL
jgi:5'-nucleotidase